MLCSESMLANAVRRQRRRRLEARRFAVTDDATLKRLRDRLKDAPPAVKAMMEVAEKLRLEGWDLTEASDEEMYKRLVVPIIDVAVQSGSLAREMRDETLAHLRNELPGIRAWIMAGAFRVHSS